MTTIIAVEKPTGVIFGADSQTTGYGKFAKEDPKFFKRGEVVFGIAGRARLSQEIKYGNVPKVRGNDVSVYVHNVLLPFIDKACEKAGINPDENILLVSVRGKVYVIEGDRSVLRRADGIYVIGSGSQWAEAHLTASSVIDADVVRRALEIAAYHDPYTSAPFHVSEGL